MSILSNRLTATTAATKVKPMTYILLSPQTPQCFGLDTVQELIEAAEEVGLTLTSSEGLETSCYYPGTKGKQGLTTQTFSYLTSHDKDRLMNVCGEHDLAGLILEVASIWDNEPTPSE